MITTNKLYVILITKKKKLLQEKINICFVHKYFLFLIFNSNIAEKLFLLPMLLLLNNTPKG